MITIMPDIATINELISVCCLRDIEAWEITSRFIIENISAQRYKVIVPSHEIEDFKKVTPPQFLIIDEIKYTSQFKEKLSKLLPSNKKDQYGWYLQQFIKILAAKDNNSSDIVLIWDADTVPIKNLQFVTPEGKLQYYKGVENHSPYFDTIRKILRLEKKVDFSFIAQCFPLKVEWLNELCHEIETNFKSSWIDVILNNIDFSEGNSFSEYETIGTFISHRHPDDVIYHDQPWWRFGNTLINHVAFLSKKRALQLSGNYDYISFEKWEKPKPYFIKVTIPYFFKVYLRKMFIKISSKYV